MHSQSNRGNHFRIYPNHLETNPTRSHCTVHGTAVETRPSTQTYFVKGRVEHRTSTPRRVPRNFKRRSLHQHCTQISQRVACLFGKKLNAQIAPFPNPKPISTHDPIGMASARMDACRHTATETRHRAILSHFPFQRSNVSREPPGLSQFESVVLL